MTQAQYAFLSLFLESEDGTTKIAELLNNDPEAKERLILAKLDGNPRTKKIIDGLDADTLEALTEELIYFNLDPAEMRGFKAGVDFILSFIGQKPIYGSKIIDHLEAKATEK